SPARQAKATRRAGPTREARPHPTLDERAGRHKKPRHMKTITSALWAAALGTMTACKGTAELNLGTVGDTMAYDQTAFTVKSGQKVHVVLTNHGTSQAMKHNWVLVNPGKEDDVATAGMTAGEAKGYVPAGNAD